ncbi:hypothetical protein U879_00590 [Defluviimonas sp. 20V17]|uniref:Uncharacterized protein n=1 Tax=Allgaiera indica TaxID=765699 RepID=A0AAN5A0L2_9RHOB|nr:hypothetical protein [Allgaiera indica]KDB05623.1 hypothetical protein U879_00590 [Defluviimonas sp. 20V17]GHE04367.1 hypothetical protein GCM10008024_31330 [Allgaiera indica]SDX40597.1 hypothetical protein SAMN05444006_11560 [Allgaiera indica]
MIFSSAATSNTTAAPGTDTLTAVGDPTAHAADFTPPAAPMAMPKQVLERAVGRGQSRRLRLPFFGGRMQGQS